MTPADIIRSAGEALFGARWQRPLAEATGKDEKQIRRYLGGESVPPPEFLDRVGMLIAERRTAVAVDFNAAHSKLCEISIAIALASPPRRQENDHRRQNSGAEE